MIRTPGPVAFAARRAGDLTSVAGFHDFLHSTGVTVARNLAIVLAVVFWLALAYWVHKDARRRIRDRFLRFLADLVGLVPPFVGPVVYLLFRPAETIADARSRHAELQALEQHLAHVRPACPVCTSPIEPDYLACPVCTTVLREPCPACRAPLEPLWQICPYCASSPAQLQDDLDAALTAETRTLVAVDDPRGLPKPAAPQAADA
jgi:Double zinc ribbon